MLGRLLVLFIVVPLVEMFLFLQVGQWIGTFPTIAFVVVTGAIGAWLTKTQGLRVINRFRGALAQGRLPQQEVLEGLLILVAGVLLLTPGLLTDAVGYLLLIPPVRLRVGVALRNYLVTRLRGASGRAMPAEPAAGPKSRPIRGPIVDAEIIDE